MLPLSEEGKEGVGRLGIVMPKTTLKKLDEWCRQQPGNPRPSTAARELIEWALEAKTKPKTRKSKAA
jgi:hypothetical protein